MHRRLVVAAALLLSAGTFADAGSLAAFSEEGAAAAGLIQFYARRCTGRRGYSLTSRAASFVADAAGAWPATFHAAYASEAQMPSQNCVGAFNYNFGPRGVVSKALGFAVMQ